jgi:ADP-heptose:LPS heptosyltransferase
MSKPKLLLRCYRAIGDTIFLAPVLPYLCEKYDVYVDCSFKAYQLLKDDPRFKKIAVFAFEQYKPEDYGIEFEKRLKELMDQVKPDKFIDMNGTIEVVCIGEDFQPEFHYPVGLRRVIYGSTSFYESIFARAELPIPNPFNTEGLYFSEAETKWAEGWRERNKGKFITIIPLHGSTYQKRFENALEVTNRIVTKYPEAIVYLAGEETDHATVPVHPQIRSLCGQRASIKQIVHLTKYADCVVGPETFIMAAAGMWGTPKIVLATASNIFQMCQFQRNDYSIQAPIWCSPCHRAIYTHGACESMLYDKDGKALYPACTTRFPPEPIMERVDKIYSIWKEAQSCPIQ